MLYFSVRKKNEKLATKLRDADPYGKDRDDLTLEDKEDMDWAPSDCSSDSQDPKTQLTNNYEPIIDVREDRKAKEEAKEREKAERRAKAQENADKKRAERAKRAADKKKKEEEEEKRKAEAEKRKADGQNEGDKEAPTKKKPATRGKPATPKKPAARGKPAAPKHPPPPPPPEKPPAPKPRSGDKKTKQEWKALYKVHVEGRKEAGKHLTTKEKAHIDEPDVNLRRRWTADGKLDLTCPYCPNRKAFANMTALEAHFNRRHRDVQLFPCNICDKKFSAKNSLLTHQKYHAMTDEEK